MDAKSFREQLEKPIAARLSSFELAIFSDKLPTSVKFQVISGDFEGMDPADRIRFLAEVVKEAFGLPLGFRPMGLALTPAEAASGDWDESKDDQDYVFGNDDGTAARSLD